MNALSKKGQREPEVSGDDRSFEPREGESPRDHARRLNEQITGDVEALMAKMPVALDYEGMLTVYYDARHQISSLRSENARRQQRGKSGDELIADAEIKENAILAARSALMHRANSPEDRTFFEDASDEQIVEYIQIARQVGETRERASTVIHGGDPFEQMFGVKNFGVTTSSSSGDEGQDAIAGPPALELPE